MFSPVYDPARVIVDGMLIPQYVFARAWKVVDVDFLMFTSSSFCVVEESVRPADVAKPYVTDEVANTWFLSAIVEVADVLHATAVV